MKWIKRILVPSDLFSPAFLLSRAVFICIVYVAVTLAGWRDYTTFLSDTVVGSDAHRSGLLGVLYLLIYFTFVLAVPIMVIAAALLVAVNKMTAARLPPQGASHSPPA